MRARRPPEALLVTTAQPSHLQEVHDRHVQYTITMSLRILCFFLAIVLPGWPLKIGAVIGAAVLPWVAVQAANMPYRTASEPRTFSRTRPAIEAGRDELSAPDAPADGS